MFGRYINGACVKGQGKPFDIVNPATEEPTIPGMAWCRTFSHTISVSSPGLTKN